MRIRSIENTPFSNKKGKRGYVSVISICVRTLNCPKSRFSGHSSLNYSKS